MLKFKSAFLFVLYLVDFTLTKLRIDDLSKNPKYEITCKLQPNEFDCRHDGSHSYGFYYDIKMEDCKTAMYGSCNDNLNKFNTIAACHEACRDEGQHIIKENISQSIICRLQPDFGNCFDYIPMWYFDVTERICRGFSYSGCGGNANRFASAQICTIECATIMTGRENVM